MLTLLRDLRRLRKSIDLPPAGERGVAPERGELAQEDEHQRSTQA